MRHPDPLWRRLHVNHFPASAPRSTPTATAAGAILTVNLGAIADNYRTLKRRLAPGADCAAVVKADAYGLGAAAVAPALAAAGCQIFFVAHVDEGISLRAVLGPAATIYVLNGL